MLCDIILLNFLKGADQYKAKKFEEVCILRASRQQHYIYLVRMKMKIIFAGLSLALFVGIRFTNSEQLFIVQDQRPQPAFNQN